MPEIESKPTAGPRGEHTGSCFPLLVTTGLLNSIYAKLSVPSMRRDTLSFGSPLVVAWGQAFPACHQLSRFWLAWILDVILIFVCSRFLCWVGKGRHYLTQN